jgi:rare lipoprotein A
MRTRCCAIAARNALVASALLTIGACGSGPPQRTIPPPSPLPSPSTQVPPSLDVSSIPDAIPRAEPKSAKGNPPFYTVLGKRYFVLSTSSAASRPGTDPVFTRRARRTASATTCTQ